jgi:hypothetical protein
LKIGVTDVLLEKVLHWNSVLICTIFDQNNGIFVKILLAALKKLSKNPKIPISRQNFISNGHTALAFWKSGNR